MGDPTTLKRGVYLDTETTGTDGRKDELLYLAQEIYGYDPGLPPGADHAFERFSCRI